MKKKESLKPIPERRKVVKDYIKQYDIENVVGEMVNSVIYEKDLSPYIYMIKYLGKYITDQEKEQFNIVIPKPYPSGYPIVKYPKFHRESTSLLKKFLDKLVWNNIKLRKTKTGVNINDLTIVSDIYPLDPVGCLITEGECLSLYAKLFIPLLSSLHHIIIDQGFKNFVTDSFELMNLNDNYLQSNADLWEKLRMISFSFSRNIAGYPFNFKLTLEGRKEIEKNILNGFQMLLDKNMIPKYIVLNYQNNLEECNEILNEINYDKEWLTKLKLAQGN